MKIAFFDSGIGGLSVLHHAMKILPDEEFIFFADEDNVPYGTKTREQVLGYVDAAFQFLTAQNIFRRPKQDAQSLPCAREFDASCPSATDIQRT